MTVGSLDLTTTYGDDTEVDIICYEKIAENLYQLTTKFDLECYSNTGGYSPVFLKQDIVKLTCHRAFEDGVILEYCNSTLGTLSFVDIGIANNEWLETVSCPYLNTLDYVCYWNISDKWNEHLSSTVITDE